MGRIPGIGACLYANVIGILRHNRVIVLTSLILTVFEFILSWIFKILLKKIRCQRDNSHREQNG